MCLGDWNVASNFLRAPLTTATRGLTCVWAGRPNWDVHHMGMGETIGYSTRLTQNNRSLNYDPRGNGSLGVHIALMGDPTMRMHPVAPVSSLTATVVGSNVQLAWTASADGTVLGYHVYRDAAQTGPYLRRTPSPVTETAYTDSSDRPGDVVYMVRAVKLEAGAGGSTRTRKIRRVARYKA